MNILSNKNSRMTSLELVEMINQFRDMENLEDNKRRSSPIEHKSLMRKIRDEVKVLQTLGLGGEGDFAPSSYINSQNKEQPCYSLSRDGVLQICAKESALVRYKLVEYMNQLEKELQQLKHPQTYVEALTSLLESEINKIKGEVYE